MKTYGGFFDFSQLKDEKEALSEKTLQSEFWNDPENARKVNSRIEQLNKLIEPCETVEAQLQDLPELVELSQSDEGLHQELREKVHEIEKRLRQLELRQMLGGENDHLPAIVSINAGSGGTEAQDWAAMIQRMLLRFAENKNFKVEIVDEQPGEEAGIKSCTFICRGEHPYGYFKSERGVHRLVRISPFDASKRRHTSFAAVDVVPEIDDSIDIQIKPDDIEMDTFRASGAGGQHVNRTDSAVRLHHLPTGVIVACQTQRSQHKNRETAMKLLKSRLYEMEMAKKQAEVDAKNKEKREISWGSQIRSYVMAPYRMVKDHRTHLETGNVEPILDGDLEAFVEAYLLQNSESETS